MSATKVWAQQIRKQRLERERQEKCDKERRLRRMMDFIQQKQKAKTETEAEASKK